MEQRLQRLSIRQLLTDIKTIMEQVNIDSLEVNIRYLQDLEKVLYDVVPMVRFVGLVGDKQAHDWLIKQYVNYWLQIYSSKTH
jgi:hypothetical protein